MKCYECEYEDCCSLREIASDLVGCEGHSKLKTNNQENSTKDNVEKHWTEIIISL